MAAPSQFGAASVPGLNPAVIQQNPNFALQSMQATRQQAIAQALMQEGMAPIDYDNRGRISWAQGLAKMLQTYQGYKMGNDAIKQQAGLQTQGMQAMGPMYGFGGGSAPADPQAIPQAAMTEGAKQGSVGPTNQNAALAAALQGRQASAAPAASPGAPLNPFGAPPMLAYMASQGDPAALEQLKTFGANATTTPEIKNNQWSGISPEQAKAMALSEATNKGFHPFAPGESWTNTFTGQGGFAPKVPDNSQPNAPFTPGSPIPSVGAVPGAIPVAARTAGAVAGADAGGRFPYQTQTVLDGSGNPTVATNGEVFPGVGGGGGGVPPRAPAVSMPAPGGAPAGQPAGLTRHTGLSATTTNLVGQGNDLLKTAQEAQKNNGQIGSYLDEMEQLNSSGAKFGPGTPQFAHALALANNYVPGIDLSKAQTNQDIMHKLSASLAGSTTARSDADLASWQARNPGAENTNAAIGQLIPLLRNKMAVDDVRANVLTKASAAGMDKLPELHNKLNQMITPSLAADGQAMAQASKNGTVQQFVQQYQKAHPSDWQARLGKIHQLDMMGGF